jgi:hypothetical protein
MTPNPTDTAGARGALAVPGRGGAPVGARRREWYCGVGMAVLAKLPTSSDVNGNASSAGRTASKEASVVAWEVSTSPAHLAIPWCV